MELIKGKANAAWSVLLYGRPGIGKSTLASLAPDAVFVDLEDGLARVECHRTPHLKTFDEFDGALKTLYKSEYKTICVDSMTGLEELLTAKILSSDKGLTSLSDIPFGRGFEQLCDEWTKTMRIFEKFRASGKNLILIAHDSIEKFANPLDADYDRYTVAIHKKALTTVISRVDAVLFGQFEEYIKSKTKNGEKVRNAGTGRRLLHTADGQAFLAKNRFNLEPVEEFSPDFWKKIV